jgi:hypothetical protein
MAGDFADAKNRNFLTAADPLVLTQICRPEMAWHVSQYAAQFCVDSLKLASMCTNLYTHNCPHD